MYDGSVSWSQHQEVDGMVEEQQMWSQAAAEPVEVADGCLCWVAAFLVDLRILTPAEVKAEADLPREAYQGDLADVQARFEREIYTYGWRRLVKYASSPARTFRLGPEVEELAFEACQEATIKFIKRLQKLWPAIQFPTFAHIRSYFFVIARHCLVDVLRKRKRQAEARAPAAPADAIKQTLAKKLPALQQWTSQQLQARVRAWLDAIEEVCDRRLIEGRFFASPPESYKEIAAALNADAGPADETYTVGQLRVRKHRLTRDLLRCLTEECQKT